MYNKKIAPLIPYAIRGAIWCQGTSNSGGGKIYAAKMEALVNGLRKNWGRPDLPFYFTRMQCYGEPDPDEVGFADIREAQTLFFMGAENVWILTGARQLDGELVRPKGGDPAPEALPLVREFRIRTKARRFRTPRKLKMEIGGGKYESSWQPADFGGTGDPPSVAAYHFASQVQQAGVPVGIVTLGAENPPLTWVSYEGMQHAAGFEKERDDLNLAYPNSEVCKAAVAKYIETVSNYNRDVAALKIADKEIPAELAESLPAFPQPYYNEWVSRTETATHTYNFCISPPTPSAIRGVIWIPGQDNVNEDVAKYTPSLEVYATSLAETYGQALVPFIFAQPSSKLVGGIGQPAIPNSASIEFDAWPKSMKEIATQLGGLAAGQSQ